MSALADALVAAQSRAVAALGKQYVGGQMDEDELRVALDSIGMTDPTDTARWVAACIGAAVCPACQLAVVVQARKIGGEGYYDEFVYADAVEEFRKEEREDASYAF